ncbi:MAG: glycosyltransferase [Alicyclobacillus sp.]|nr:glycosyltransferase [Alicyclobacillus sp.]
MGRRAFALVMRKVQFGEAQGPRVFAERLRRLADELGYEVVFVAPERRVAADAVLPGYEHERGDLVNYDLVVDQIRAHDVDHVLFTVAGFAHLNLFFPHCALFPHSFPDPALPDSHLMLPFYRAVDKALVQTAYLRERAEEMGIQDVSVMPIGFDERLAKAAYRPDAVVPNRVLWIGRDDRNRRPEIPISFARRHPQVDVHLVFGGLRYRETMQRFALPENVTLHFALSQAEVFALMNTAKVYWSSSCFDTYAMPLTEAMAMGKWVVRPMHPCYGHIAGPHVLAGDETNWNTLLELALAAPQAVSEDNREVAFSRFGTAQMKAALEEFLERWWG